MEEACLGLTPSSSDNFTPAQHKIKDEEVTQAVSEIFGEKSELSTPECAMLLECIIGGSEGKLTSTTSVEAAKLMRKNSKLENALNKAWRTKDYHEIRESGERRASLAGSCCFPQLACGRFIYRAEAL